MNYRDKIRKYIECPEFGNSSYGAWGSLRIDQRRNIKRLLDELDGADDYIKKLYKENQQLKEQLQQKEDIINKAKEYIINNSLYEEEYDYDYEENIYLSEIHDDDVRRILVEILDNKGE